MMHQDSYEGLKYRIGFKFCLKSRLQLYGVNQNLNNFKYIYR